MKKERYKSLSDLDLIDLHLSSQGSNYFGILYDRYINKVYSKCLALLKNEASARDAAQDVFLKIYLNLSKFNKKSRFSTWIYSITYNYCIDSIRKEKKKKNLFVDDIENEPDVIDEVDDAEIIEMEIGRLKRIMERLSIDDKSVLLMKYQDEMTIKEISGAIEKSESAVKMKIKRAKHRVRTYYNEIFEN